MKNNSVSLYHKNIKTMTLVEILKAETKSLKEQYIEKTKEWAKDHHQYLVKLKNEYCSKEFIEKYGKNHYYETEKLVYRMSSVIYSPVENYIEKNVKLAELHYEDSILKLANRIEKKGLVVENIKATTSHVGVNINTTLTDGVKSVRAFTIVASGAVQRPHYRYLIK